MPQYNFSMPLTDFDQTLLPAGGPAKGSPDFAAAAHKYLEGQFAGFGGTAQIGVDPETIRIAWDAQPGTTPLEAAVAKLEAGELAPAVMMLQLLLRERPDDANVLYNLGLALSDTGRLRDAQTHLRRLLDIDPRHVNAMVALGVAFARQGKLEQAAKHLRKACEIEPRNSWAQRNLGACLAKLGRTSDAIGCFERAAKENPRDQQAFYGLGEALRQQGKNAEADAAYREVIKIDEHGEIAEQAKKGLTLLARKGFEERARGDVRPDAVMYCLAALKKFAGMDKAQVQKIAFEVALLGRSGLDVNDAKAQYRLQSMPGDFSGLHLMCYMFVGFKAIAPDQDIGFDLSKEYELATQMLKSK